MRRDWVAAGAAEYVGVVVREVRREVKDVSRALSGVKTWVAMVGGSSTTREPIAECYPLGIQV